MEIGGGNGAVASRRDICAQDRPVRTTDPAATAASPVLLCGYYGEHNLGDDALLEVLLQQLPTAATPLVTARDGQQVHDRFGVATVDRRSLVEVLAALGRCRALVLGGGSLLQDSTSFNSLLYYAALILAAWCQGKPVLLWGQGLGPLCRRRSRMLVRALLPLVSRVCWRDPASAQLAERLGRSGGHAPDPVWASPPVQWRGRGGPIVLCWRPTPLLQGTAWLPYLEALDRLAAHADREVIWLPLHLQQDPPLLDSLTAEGLLSKALQQRSRQVEALTPREAKAVFSTSGLVVAMRLHGLILAAVSGAPCAALSYDPKVKAAAGALGCLCHGLDQPADAGQLQQLWRAALDAPVASAHVGALAAQACRHGEVLAGL
jgi:polysaccharide pyruvyl transferase CsaB